MLNMEGTDCVGVFSPSYRHWADSGQPAKAYLLWEPSSSTTPVGALEITQLG